MESENESKSNLRKSLKQTKLSFGKPTSQEKRKREWREFPGNFANYRETHVPCMEGMLDHYQSFCVILISISKRAKVVSHTAIVTSQSQALQIRCIAITLLFERSWLWPWAQVEFCPFSLNLISFNFVVNIIF